MALAFCRLWSSLDCCSPAGVRSRATNPKSERRLFCLLTLAFGEIFRLVTQAWIGFTGGAMGIVGIPIPTVFGWEIKSEVDFYFLGIAFWVHIRHT